MDTDVRSPTDPFGNVDVVKIGKSKMSESVLAYFGYSPAHEYDSELAV